MTPAETWMACAGLGFALGYVWLWGYSRGDRAARRELRPLMARAADDIEQLREEVGTMRLREHVVRRALESAERELIEHDRQQTPAKTVQVPCPRCGPIDVANVDGDRAPKDGDEAGWTWLTFKYLTAHEIEAHADLLTGEAS